MKKEPLEIFAEETNFAVIKLPNRKYPGVLIQGDSLAGLLADIEEAIKLFDSDRDEALEALKSIRGELRWRFEAYKKVLKMENFKPAE